MDCVKVAWCCQPLCKKVQGSVDKITLSQFKGIKVAYITTNYITIALQLAMIGMH